MPKATLQVYIDGAVEEFRQLLEDNDPAILKMINDSEGRDATLPVSLYICDAPGSQHIDVKLTLTTKKVFTGHLDIDPPNQIKMDVVVKEAKEASPTAKAKAKQSKARAEKKLAKKTDDDGPE